LKIKAEERGLLDNTWNDVYQMFKSGDVSAARAAATERGLAFDPANPKSISEMEMRAKRSPDYKAAQEEARKAAKEGREVSEEDRKAAEARRKELGVGTGKDVPAGVREVVSDGQVYFVDANGKKLTQEQINAMNERKARAGAPTTVIGGASGSKPVGQPGTVNGLDPKTGAATKDVTAGLGRTRPLAEKAANAFPLLEDIAKVLESGNVPESRVGSAVADVAGMLPGGMQPEFARNAQRLESSASALLGLIDDPRLKCNPVVSEARDVKRIIADPTISLEDKKARLATLRARLEAAVTEHNEAVDQYTPATQQRLKALGLGTVNSERAGRDTAPKAATITPADFDAQWAKLPKGGQLVGPDGKTYTKR
jgi:hypothetical protein